MSLEKKREYKSKYKQYLDIMQILHDGQPQRAYKISAKLATDYYRLKVRLFEMIALDLVAEHEGYITMSESGRKLMPKLAEVVDLLEEKKK